MTVGEIYRQLRNELTPVYGAGEATAMARLIFHFLKGWNTTGLVVHEGDMLSPFMVARIDEIVTRLKTGEPLQYILGEADFYGMRLKVNPDTLIPRPETEELVEMIIRDAGDRSDLRVLDVGTGSGAIAIALSRNLRFPTVTALDISEGAIRVAEENAGITHANIKFLREDIFEYHPEDASLDIIVSNPPYICEKEKESMEKNVLEYEPHGALFVPDSDPLRFYRRIAEVGRRALSDEGMLYFEINPLYAEDVRKMTEQQGYSDVEIIKDLSGKNRFLKARRIYNR